jgi:hypothetical protein
MLHASHFPFDPKFHQNCLWQHLCSGTYRHHHVSCTSSNICPIDPWRLHQSHHAWELGFASIIHGWATYGLVHPAYNPYSSTLSETVFFSHNKSVNSVFQPAYQHSRTRPMNSFPLFIVIILRPSSQYHTISFGWETSSPIPFHPHLRLKNEKTQGQKEQMRKRMRKRQN